MAECTARRQLQIYVASASLRHPCVVAMRTVRTPNIRPKSQSSRRAFPFLLWRLNSRISFAQAVRRNLRPTYARNVWTRAKLANHVGIMFYPNTPVKTLQENSMNKRSYISRSGSSTRSMLRVGTQKKSREKMKENPEENRSSDSKF